MLRCYLTSLEISANQAYMLDKKAIQNRLWKISREQAHLTRLMEKLAPIDTVKAKGRKRLHHRLVCNSVAKSLSYELRPFKPFTPWRNYHISLHLERLKCLHEDAQPDSMLSNLKHKDLHAIATFAWKVIGRLKPQLRNDKEFIKTLVELICPAFYILDDNENTLNYMSMHELTVFLLSAGAEREKVLRFEQTYHDSFPSTQIIKGCPHGNVLK